MRAIHRLLSCILPARGVAADVGEGEIAPEVPRTGCAAKHVPGDEDLFYGSDKHVALVYLALGNYLI